MAKIDLNTVSSGYLSQAALNANFTAIEDEFQDKVLYRDNPVGEPNSMATHLDMNGFSILNVGNLDLEDPNADNIPFDPSGTGAVSRTVGNKLRDTVSVQDFGAVGDGVANDTAAVQAFVLALQTSGSKGFIPAGTYLCTSQIVVHRACITGEDSVLKFQSLGASTDCLVLQGSAREDALELSGIHVDANSTGRDAVVLSGGKSGSTSADFLTIDGMRILNAVRDALHIEPALNYCWLENIIFRSVRITNPGRHGLACIVPDLTNVFANKISLYDFEVRGAGQITAAYDVFVDLQGTVADQKASEWVFVNPEFDVAGSAFHQQGSIRIQRSGSNGFCHSWTFIGGTFEDVGSTITGFPYVVSLGASGLAEGLCCIGGAIVEYGSLADASLFTNIINYQSSSGRNLIKIDGQLRGTSLVLANAAVTDSSTLDWYEENTFTPTIQFGGASTGITYNTQYGSFTRIGNRVYFSIVIALTSKGTATGNLTIQSLPYSSSESAAISFAVFGQNVAAGINNLVAIASGTTAISVRNFAGGAAGILTDADCTNTTDIRVSGHYRV